MKSRFHVVSAVALVLGLTVANNSQAGFTNGSFEAEGPTCTGDPTGWTISADGYGLNPFGTTYGTGMDGVCWAWLAGYEANRFFEQTLSGLTAGTTYAVDFIMASEYVNSDQVHVSADGGPAALFSAPPYSVNFWDTWGAREFDFVASGTSATIRFDTTGLNAPGYDVGIDNVTLRTLVGNPVPEPGSIALISLGLTGLAALRRRRQR
jgi:PEP-CTERM motif